MHSEEEIFESAAALPAAERPSYLDTACAGHPEIRARIEALLRSHDVTGFMEDNAAAAKNPILRTEWNRLQPEETGQRIGHYKLMEQIGEGGFGAVWVAEQLEPVRRRVALKIIKPGMDSREIIARFEHERQALAMMDHPNIAKVFDAGATDKGRPFFVMELVRGVKITDYCDRENLPTTQRLKLLITVCQAVQHAHQKGIIHRDLKPSNILVTPGDGGEPIPKVIDFGVAKAIQQQSLTDATVYTQFEQMVGTPAYMSPEQAGLGPMDIDTRSDVYSLGVLLYELLTGRPPFDSKTLLSAGLDEMRRVIREVEPPKPSTRISSLTAPELSGTAARRHVDPPKLISSIRGDLDWIAMKALEKNRVRRYESATGLATDLLCHLENLPVLARPPGKVYLLSKFILRHKFGFATGVAISLSLLAGVVAALWGIAHAEAARKAAEAETAKTKLANETNKRNLHLASMDDHASAVKALDEDSEAAENNETTADFSNKSRWHEGLFLLTRSLEREPDNHSAALRLYDTLRRREPAKRDWTTNGPDGTQTNGESEDQALKNTGATTANLSPDGTRIVIVSRSDKTAIVRDAATGRSIGKPMRHQDEVTCANFSPDGLRIVTASHDRTAKVWETSTGKLIGDAMRHPHFVDHAEFITDGNQILTVGFDDGVPTRKIWDMPAGHEGATPTTNISPMLVRPILSKREYEQVLIIDSAVLTWAKNLAGLWFAEDGQLQLISDGERTDVIRNIVLPPVAWADLSKWINTPTPWRTIDPKSNFTFRQIAERERDFEGDGNVQSLESALRYDFTVPLARLFYAAAEENANAANDEKDSNVSTRAAFLRRYDLDALAREKGKMKNDELAALWARAANHLAGLTPDTKVGIGPKPTTAREEAAIAARKALELIPGLPAAEEALKKLQP